MGNSRSETEDNKREAVDKMKGSRRVRDADQLVEARKAKPEKAIRITATIINLRFLIFVKFITCLLNKILLQL